MNRRRAPRLLTPLVLCELLAVTLVAAAATPQGPSTVDLLELGSEPRHQIRYAETPSATQLTATVSTVIGTAFGEADPTTSPVPTLVMHMNLAVSPADTADRRRFGIKIDDASLADTPPVNPMIRAIMEKYMPYFPGFEGHLLTEASGRTIETSLTAVLSEEPEKQQPLEALHQTLWLYPVAFPDEAIGVGARWRVSSASIDFGIKENLHVQRVLEYELAQIEEGRLRVLVRLHDTGESKGEAFVTPTNPPMTLRNHQSSGDGQVVLDAEDCSLISGSSQRTFAFEMDVEIGETIMTGRGSGEIEVKIERTPVAGAGEGDS